MELLLSPARESNPGHAVSHRCWYIAMKQNMTSLVILGTEFIEVVIFSKSLLLNCKNLILRSRNIIITYSSILFSNLQCLYVVLLQCQQQYFCFLFRYTLLIFASAELKSNKNAFIEPGSDESRFLRLFTYLTCPVLFSQFLKIYIMLNPYSTFITLDTFFLYFFSPIILYSPLKKRTARCVHTIPFCRLFFMKRQTEIIKLTLQKNGHTVNIFF